MMYNDNVQDFTVLYLYMNTAVVGSVFCYFFKK